MEGGDRARRQGKAGTRPVAREDHEAVVDEIEIDLEAARAIGDRRGGEPARGDVEHHVPPVIGHGRQRQADLADDLGPELQRRAGVAPFGERERWVGVEVGRRHGGECSAVVGLSRGAALPFESTMSQFEFPRIATLITSRILSSVSKCRTAYCFAEGIP